MLGDFSNDGRFLTLLATRDGRVKVDVYDFRRQKLTEYPLASRIHPLVQNADLVHFRAHTSAVVQDKKGHSAVVHGTVGGSERFEGRPFEDPLLNEHFIEYQIANEGQDSRMLLMNVVAMDPFA